MMICMDPPKKILQQPCNSGKSLFHLLILYGGCYQRFVTESESFPPTYQLYHPVANQDPGK